MAFVWLMNSDLMGRWAFCSYRANVILLILVAPSPILCMVPIHAFLWKIDLVKEDVFYAKIIFHHHFGRIVQPALPRRSNRVYPTVLGTWYILDKKPVVCGNSSSARYVYSVYFLPPKCSVIFKNNTCRYFAL